MIGNLFLSSEVKHHQHVTVLACNIVPWLIKATVTSVLPISAPFPDLEHGHRRVNEGRVVAEPERIIVE